MSPLSNYERYRDDEAEWSGEAEEDLRRSREAIAIDEAAFAAAKAREASYDLYGIDGEEFPHMAPHMSRWLDRQEYGS